MVQLLLSQRIIGALVWGLCIQQSLSVPQQEASVDANGSAKKEIQLTDITKSTFSILGSGISWLSNDLGKDGWYTSLNSTDKNYWIKSTNDAKENHVLFNLNQLKDSNGKVVEAEDYVLSADLKFLLVEVNYTKLWTKSSFGSFYLFNLSDLKTPGRIINKNFDLKKNYNATDNVLSLVQWSPKGHNLAFVQDNDIYTLTSDFAQLTQVTKTGSEVVQNGVPDWVYEEEVVESGSSIWWGPNDQLAFVTYNDTKVPVEILNSYTTRANNGVFTKELANYPQYYSERYPKPGFTNPSVTFNVAKITNKGAEVKPVALKNNKILSDEILIFEAGWVKDESCQLLVQFTNRVQNKAYFAVVDAESTKVTIARDEVGGANVLSKDLKGDGGWYYFTHATHLPPLPKHGLKEASYLVNVVADGYNHIALYSPVNSPKPKVVLTSGKYDVVSILGVDEESGYVYYSSTEVHSSAKDIYRVDLNGKNKVHISKSKETGDLQKTGTYSASVSPGGKYVILNYNGPGIPTRHLTIRGDQEGRKLLQDNAELKKKVDQYNVANYYFRELKVNGNTINSLEVRPANFNPKKKYNVIFYVYGGPNSQMVTRDFKIDQLKYFVANNTDTIIVSADGRGTGFKGRDFLISVLKRLGDFESEDQIAAAKYFQTLDYINKDNFLIYGKSYGGYMTLKTLERQPQNPVIFKGGASVSPVSDWHLYDTVYTERFMHELKDNIQGYNTTGIRNFNSFKSVDLLLTHGTRDDNVHFDNSMYVVNQLVYNDIYRFKFVPYIDNDHYYPQPEAKYHYFATINSFFKEQFARKN